MTAAGTVNKKIVFASEREIRYTVYMTWKKLTDKNHVWKTHVAPADLVPFIQHELEERWKRDLESGAAPNELGLAPEAPEFITEKISSSGMDSGGMCMQTRAIRHIDIDGLEFSVPSQDWTNILSSIRLETSRRFSSGVEYYKIHSLYFCLVLTPAQRDHLVSSMEDQAEAAEVESDEDDAKFAKAINALNESMGRTAVISKKVEAINAAAEGKKGLN